jgi:uncharacterized metal-binding protein
MRIAADERIVIDGCPVACARKIIEEKGMRIDRYVVITELGLIKTPGPSFNANDVQTVIAAVRQPPQS